MDNWLTHWCLTSGMSLTQYEAQNAECQVQMVAVWWPPWAAVI